MTKREYISSKFASIGLTLTDADLLDMNIENVDDEITDTYTIYIKFVQFIPALLLRPTSISEGGTSISRASKADIEAFYSTECKRLGVKNELAPKVRFR